MNATIESDRENSAGATGQVRLILRAEGLILFAASLWAYHHIGLPWGWFALLFLLPDLSMAAYAIHARAGALCYNLAHTTVIYGALSAVGWKYGLRGLLIAGIVGLAHVGFDRFAGYGLKYARGFSYTHLGMIGKQKSNQ